MGERGLEWSSYETSTLTPNCLNEEDKGLVMMLKMGYEIQFFASLMTLR